MSIYFVYFHRDIFCIILQQSYKEKKKKQFDLLNKNCRRFRIRLLNFHRVGLGVTKKRFYDESRLVLFTASLRRQKIPEHTAVWCVGIIGCVYECDSFIFVQVLKKIPPRAQFPHPLSFIMLTRTQIDFRRRNEFSSRKIATRFDNVLYRHVIIYAGGENKIASRGLEHTDFHDFQTNNYQWHIRHTHTQPTFYFDVLKCARNSQTNYQGQNSKSHIFTFKCLHNIRVLFFFSVQ